MLRACVIEFRGSWDKHIALMEFAYNNQYHSSIGMAPYEALYGWKCRSPIYWDEERERILEGPELVQELIDKIQIVKQSIRAAQYRQKSYVDLHRREISYKVRQSVFKSIPMERGSTLREKGEAQPQIYRPL